MKRAITILTLLSGTAWAEGQVVPGDAAAVAEAPHYMEVTGRVEMARLTVENMRLYVMATLARGGLDFQQRAELTEQVILPELRAAVPKLLQQWTDIFAAQLSADDMKAMEAFVQTPAGQHFLAAQGAITTSLQTATTSWEAGAVREAIDKHLNTLHEHGYAQ